MKWYLIYSDKTKIKYKKQFKSSMDARHWVINHLDLSLNWNIEHV